MNDKELQQAFIEFLAQKSGAKNQKDLEKYIQQLGEEGLNKAYEEFTQLMSQKAQKAAHGAKLRYIKSLKNQCNDDEELVYFKRGGSLDCGCVKKKETGGEMDQTPKKNPVQKFKNRKTNSQKPINPNDTIHTKFGVRSLTDKETRYKRLSKEEYRKLSDSKKMSADEKDAVRGRQSFEKGGKTSKKGCGGLKLASKGGRVCPKCGKIHSAGMGCIVAKFKANN